MISRDQSRTQCSSPAWLKTTFSSFYPSLWDAPAKTVFPKTKSQQNCIRCYCILSLYLCSDSQLGVIFASEEAFGSVWRYFWLWHGGVGGYWHPVRRAQDVGKNLQGTEQLPYHRIIQPKSHESLISLKTQLSWKTWFPLALRSQDVGVKGLLCTVFWSRPVTSCQLWECGFCSFIGYLKPPELNLVLNVCSNGLTFS